MAQVDVFEVLRWWLERQAAQEGGPAALSRRTKIPKSTLSNIRQGDRRVTLDLLVKAAAATHLPMSMVLRQLAGIAQEIEEGKLAPALPASTQDPRR